MTVNVAVNVDDLGKTITDLYSLKENVITYVNNISTVIENIQSGWVGQDASTYVESIMTFKNAHLGVITEYIDGLAKAVEISKNIVSETQDTVKTQIANLENGDIGPTASTMSFSSTIAAEGVAGISQVATQSQTLESNNNTSAVATTEYVPNTYKAKPYSVSEEDKNKLYALVFSEDGGTKEGALAVMSTICNRADSGAWGGTDPITVAFAKDQFVGSKSSNYAKAISNPDIVPQYVKEAVDEALNGTRNHNYMRFRGNQNAAPGRVQIGENGNYYF